MDVLDLINHLLNFVLPALALAILMPLSTRWTRLGRTAKVRLPTQMLLHGVLNTLVLATGLWVFGHDGRMLSYMGMATLCASTHWLLLAAWRT